MRSRDDEVDVEQFEYRLEVEPEAATPMTRKILRTLAAGMTMTAVALTSPSILDSQTSTSVFPVYDGFLKNDDGTLLLSFAYFNHNRTTITIPPGPANRFMTGAPDRGQTTTFLPGHHRWQCIMVVDGDFDGVLRWQISHGDESYLTSESMLQYSWEFDAAGTRQALRDVDLASAPRDVCLNRSPIVRVLGPSELTGAVGQAVKLFGSVRDEGLPRDAAVTAAWHQTNGPGTVSFDAADQARTLAFFDAPGTYAVELLGSDTVFERSAQVTVVVR